MEREKQNINKYKLSSVDILNELKKMLKKPNEAADCCKMNGKENPNTICNIMSFNAINELLIIV